MDALKVLEDNYYSRNNSFIYFLHEESLFNKESFWIYYDCLCALSRMNNQDKFTQPILKMVQFTYSYILKSVLYHFDTNDLYRIKYFPRKNYIYYLERLDIIIESFYNEFSIDSVDFGGYITRPKK